MGISDILELIGILIAVIAIISEKYRDYIFLKFGGFDLFGIYGAFILINYLIFYDWFQQRIPFISCFEIKNWPSPNTWAYIITLGLLSYIIYKIFYSKFPENNIKKVQTYFIKLMNEGEFTLLSKIIEDLYLVKIPAYINERKNFNPPVQSSFSRRTIDIKNSSDFYKLLQNKKLTYESMIYEFVISDESFIAFVTERNPYYLTDILTSINDEKVENKPLFNVYLKNLLSNKNRHLKRELFTKNSSGFHSAYTFPRESKILKALVIDTNVASINNACLAMAEIAIKEMNKEIKCKYSDLRVRDIRYISVSQEDMTVVWAFEFSDIVLRSALEQRVPDHLILHYIPKLLNLLLENLEKEDGSHINNKNTLTYKITENLLSNLTDWIEMSIKNELHLHEDILGCMGQIIWEIGSTNKFNKEVKDYFLNLIWEKFVCANITFSSKASSDVKSITKEYIDEVRNLSINKFKKPSMLFEIQGYESDHKMYKSAIISAFNGRDEHNYGNSHPSVKKFKEEVINKFV